MAAGRTDPLFTYTPPAGLEGFVEAMPAFIKDSEFQICVRNLLAHRQYLFEAAHGSLGAKNHPVCLPGEMKDIGAVAGRLEQPINEYLGASDFEARSQRAAGIDQCNEVLRMALRGAFKFREGFIESIRLP